MVADVEELLEVKRYLAAAVARLDDAGIPFDRNYRLGVMVEVPSALWALPLMLPEIDFVSIGTNDLVQYAFAVDRGNPKVNKWFRQFHPIALRMIRETCEAVAQFPGKSLSVCGEIAGNPVGAPLLIGAGVRHFSMSPWRIPDIVDAVAKVTVPECEEIAERAMACGRDQDVVEIMHSFARHHGITAGLPAEDA
jgi:phosphoenolpyruvate-protein kinase (PTS system EI component)